MMGWIFSLGYGIIGPPAWSLFLWLTLDRRAGRSLFLFRWMIMAPLAAGLQMIPDPVHGHAFWQTVTRALIGEPDMRIAIGNMISFGIAVLVWLWLRRKDKIRAALRSLRERERAVIAAMVRTMKERRRVPARAPLPQPG